MKNSIWLEFTVGHLCGLCANHGIMPEITTISSAGAKVTLPAGKFCICPNGRGLKKLAEKVKGSKTK